ncbi:hypothetical protein SAMN02745912_00827 [Paramaledivibacter caminithermalis DSM 15212]|jgi:hypothetical protein|uniref:Uncharacterized protein n=1 Tax=Paramaledivibacter caminithermalis (strain DSM 15212 / CIP 107654 / DViRD3) TaxID=1121301 RepID=A0A1M6LJC9_PARC5|nr:hypothetical protein SAMN02745912_00827 [Paramaledivibacter caminithermalis DSM 15212]
MLIMRLFLIFLLKVKNDTGNLSFIKEIFKWSNFCGRLFKDRLCQ